MPRSFVTSTHAAPNSWRYSSAWSIALLRADALSKRSRNCGTSALTALVPANAAVRPVRKAWTPRRTPARARRIDSSAVRFACSEVSPNVTPSTATTSNVAARKILAARPSRTGLVALDSGIGRVVLAVLVLVGLPAEPARVELDVGEGRARGADRHQLRDLRAPLVPGVQGVLARRHSLDGEAPVRRGLRVVRGREDLGERDHARVDVAEDADQAGAREREALCFAASVLAEIERVRLARRKHVVVEGIVVREADRGAERERHHPWDEVFVVHGDLDGRRPRGRRRAGLEIQHRGPEVGSGPILLLEDGDTPGDPRAPALRFPVLPHRHTAHTHECHGT